MMTTNQKQIFRRLQTIRNKAIAPYSQFRVAAIIRTREGKLYSGHNIESSSYGLTICAERVALFKALSEGERKFAEIHILAEGKEFCPPCGACRQILMDFAPGITIILYNYNGECQTYKIKELLPDAFTAKRLVKPSSKNHK